MLKSKLFSIKNFMHPAYAKISLRIKVKRDEILLNGTYLELEYCVRQDCRVWEDVEVEGSADVFVGLLLPPVGTDTHLKGIHADTVVAQLLIAIS